ncbi:MAG: YbaB/EbfC family nucleoid-associated protein [Acidocella sp. 20-57-95]|nr:MAG: YbaB/EbfC family nucleoid-associated protein [Acidocella sp. 20-57-95]OYV60246.1 MAG: YbaB/EbfC family nucleoid-associated protein [Acidocella sp. 21-58-7]HQT63461.1 YbaB/EbfC family nucleoid-associated protein [Acidocella sp.]HQU04847.1 YbaB/EbfC family nucleoid-associated protein [Acidocella sp.]
MKNLAGLMQQAKQMQANMEAMQAKLEAAQIEGVSGAGLVRVTLTGKGILKSIKIDPKVVDAAETEMLEDLIVAAHADAKSKLDAFAEAEMKTATGGMQLPAGLKLPF